MEINTGPLTVESITTEFGEPPESLKLFLTTLLCIGNKRKTDKLETLPRLVESFCADFVHAVSNGKVITPKHYLLDLGIHNMTGQKLPIQIMNRLGHCVSYPKVCEIETALAELSIQQSEGLNILPVLPEGDYTNYYGLYQFIFGLIILMRKWRNWVGLVPLTQLT